MIEYLNHDDEYQIWTQSTRRLKLIEWKDIKRKESEQILCKRRTQQDEIRKEILAGNAEKEHVEEKKLTTKETTKIDDHKSANRQVGKSLKLIDSCGQCVKMSEIQIKWRQVWLSRFPLLSYFGITWTYENSI